MGINFKRYWPYLLRWQASTPILAGVGTVLAAMGQIIAAIIANLIGGLIFFLGRPVYLYFTVACGTIGSQGQYHVCVDCEKIARGYRLVKSGDYDKTEDNIPEFRCEECSKKKNDALRDRGVKVE
jgi:hypothetical protein